MQDTSHGSVVHWPLVYGRRCQTRLRKSASNLDDARAKHETGVATLHWNDIVSCKIHPGFIRKSSSTEIAPEKERSVAVE